MDKKITSAAWLALQRVLDLCMEISTTTKADCFFSYSPHVNSYMVYIHRDGWTEGAEIEWLDMNSDITAVNLQRTINELRKLHEEVKEKENV